MNQLVFTIGLLYVIVTMVTARDKLTLTKCCLGHFNILMDQCQDLGDKIVVGVWPPAVYSRRENRTITSNTKDNFQLKYLLNPCPDGYVTSVVMDFRLYDDGSLTTASLHLNRSSEFCVDQVLPIGNAVPFIARFCVADPCDGSSCIRKCCPRGMVVSGRNQMCQHSENASDIDDANLFIVNTAKTPICTDGIRLDVDADLHPEEEDIFNVVPSDRNNQSQTIANYCVDNIVFDNITESSMVCSAGRTEDASVLYIYPYFIIVSILFLMVTFLAYVSLPEVRTIRGVIICCHVASLTVMYISLGAIHLRPPNGPPCQFIHKALAAIAHFSCLSSFTWLNVLSFNIWRTFCANCPSVAHQQRNLGTRFMKYSAYALGVPIVIVLIGQMLDNCHNLPDYIIKPNFGREMCWFQDAYQLRGSTMIYLYGPLAAIVLINVVFYVLTAQRLYRTGMDTDFSTDQDNTNQKCRVMYSLVILIGASWMMEIITFPMGGLEYIWIPTDITNTVTAVFIIVIRKLFKKKWMQCQLIHPRRSESCPSTTHNQPIIIVESFSSNS